MRVITCILAALCFTTAAAAAGESLRHVEYAVTTQVDGRASASHLVLELVGTTAERGVRLEIAEADAAEPVRVRVDANGTATVEGGAQMSREAKLLVYFFALGAQNMTGLGRGDEWGADGMTGDGAQHRTRFRVVRTPAEGRLDIAFTRKLELSDERADYRGRLLYDAFKVVPIAFDASGEVRASEAGAERAHDVRLAVKLLRDSQP
ncbi:MAG: hypothetical protein QOD51_1239 [Candidatus Eremiobacteraeota bacterium]|nr:hypothetical protein [Candidatus Eremiobacteraeota bacterium]